METARKGELTMKLISSLHKIHEFAPILLSVLESLSLYHLFLEG
jgi:hypothetical protein